MIWEIMGTFYCEIDPCNFLHIEKCKYIFGLGMLNGKRGKYVQFRKMCSIFAIENLTDLKLYPSAFAIFMSPVVLYKYDESSTMLYWIQEKRRTSQVGDIGHHMGGVIRKDFNSKVTHLVANCTQGEKFRVCKFQCFCVFQYSTVW